MIKRTLLGLLICLGMFTYSLAGAELKVFEKEVESIAGEDQTQGQIESFIWQQARRLALEEAGSYLSNLPVVQNYHLQKDEVIALASGIVRTAPAGLASAREANGITSFKIKAKINIETNILDSQINDIMKVKETLPETLQRVAQNRERVIVRRRGKDVAAIVPIEDLAALEEMEDRMDTEDFLAAKKRWQRGGLKTVPWDKLKAELGL